MNVPRARVRALAAGASLAILLLGGCATTGDPRDPFEPVNRAVYGFNEEVDKAVIKPAAQFYRDVVPPPVRTGVSNFFSNIGDVVNALNNLLQGKVPQAINDVGRLVVNTAFGIFGVRDVASDLGIEKSNEDFGQTLGRWGFGDGPYVVLPLLGPSSARDTVGWVGDIYSSPLTYIDPAWQRNSVIAFRFLTIRADLLEASRILDTAALDPYEFVRDAYLQRRRNLVHDGNPPPDKAFDLEPETKPGPQPRPETKPAKPVSGIPPSPDPLSSAGSGTPAVRAAGTETAPKRAPQAPRHVRVWLSNPRN